MTELNLLEMRDLAEAGQVQFKERLNDRYDISCEIAAFSNSRGGRLVIGINDKSGVINALSFVELQETTNLLTSIASESVTPGVLIDIENVPTRGGAVCVATIPEGKNKPYHDNKGITNSANEFIITIPRKSNPATIQDSIINDQAPQNTTNPTLKSDQVNDQVPQNTTNPTLKSDQADKPCARNTTKTKLSKKQQDIRNFCSVPRTGKEILLRAGVADHFDSRKRYIYDLVEAGVLERTIPDKPNDPNQKYRRKK